ncbi:MAG: ECF-type sigma factor [Gammaproteobacteria bacterium]|nr:ECF-type sigma factor [Gammaproteobacteria bacterium]MDH4255531.1 ECF-type sigma factor [Gammaproteobacteria bacterium]MDH5311564.1 ECF-type sigma factor [Gammaproteobacteria bacterium]
MDGHEITQLLKGWQAGDEAALDRLTPLVYEQLRKLASRMFGRESPGHTLQPTALVNEAMQQMIGTEVDWQDRNHFFALSARMMRRILVNHANAKNTAKRGGHVLRVTMEESHAVSEGDTDADVLALDMALTELAEFDERKARMIELHYFGGLTYQELAGVMRVAESTVHQDLRTAKAWLRQNMSR